MSSLKLVSFKLHNQIYGINLKFVREVGKISSFFKIPSKVDYFEGLYNLKGIILPVINLGKRIGINVNIPSNFLKYYIFLNDTQYSFIIIIDKILGVQEIDENTIKNLNNKNLIEDIIIENGEILSFIDVKKIIDINDFKYSKRFFFKSLHSIEDLSVKKIVEEKNKISFTIFKINNEIFGIDSMYIKQLISSDNKNFKFFSLDNLVVGELEFDNKIIEVLNLPLILRTNIKLDNYLIVLIEKEETILAFIIPEDTGFIVIEEQKIMKEISIVNNFSFLNQAFKYNNEYVKIIDIEKLINFLTLKAIEE